MIPPSNSLPSGFHHTYTDTLSQLVPLTKLGQGSPCLTHLHLIRLVSRRYLSSPHLSLIARLFCLYPRLQLLVFATGHCSSSVCSVCPAVTMSLSSPLFVLLDHAWVQSSFFTSLVMSATLTHPVFLQIDELSDFVCQHFYSQRD